MKWYKRDPDAALSGMAELTFEECGAYNRLLDLLYSRDGKVADDDNFCARIFHCNPRTWRKLKQALISKRKVRSLEGRLTANRVEFELNAARIRVERTANARAMALKAKQNQQRPSLSTDGQPQPDIREGSSLISTSRSIKLYALSDPADPTSGKKLKKRKPSKPGYSTQFEAFWKAYPTTRNMSKKEAWDVWLRLGPEDQALALDAVPKYKQWLNGKGERAPEVIHACRFLSKRRFDGHAAGGANGGTAAHQFYAAFGSDELEAWDAYGRMTKGNTYPRDKRGGWYFPSQWPPERIA
jgi:uncharacterized protein YdaU (DUF1376 family)